MTMASGAASSSPRNRSSAALRSLTSRTAAETRRPSAVSSGLRLISTGNSVPSLRRPWSSSPAPMGRTWRLFGVAVAMLGVVGPEAARDQDFDGLAQEFLALVAEQGLGLGIDEPDDSRVVDDDHGVRRRLQQPPEPLLGGFTVTDVTDGGGHKQAVGGLQRTETDFDRELSTVLAQPVQFQPRTHRPHLTIVGIAVPMLGMMRTETTRDQQLDRLTQQFLTLITEQSLGLRIDQLDDARVVNDDHRVRRRLQQPPEPILGFPGERTAAAAGRPLAPR